MDLALKAAAHAKVMHGGQERKYTGEPYFNHVRNVAKILEDHGFDEVVVAAAYLHDTVEDTEATEEQLKLNFGFSITKLVMEVTDVSKPEDGNRELRKAKDRVHLSKSSPDGASIKLADIIDNTRDIVANDHKFAKTYLREKDELLSVLQHGDPRLWNLAKRTVEEGKALIAESPAH